MLREGTQQEKNTHEKASSPAGLALMSYSHRHPELELQASLPLPTAPR